jgi:dihydrodipicolinate synthase/N-acetylneuraminate lyase
VSSLSLSKAARTYVSKTYHLLPHQVLAAEQLSLRNRLEDKRSEKQKLLQQLELTDERQEFHYLLKKELPKLDQMIERLSNELQRISTEQSKRLKDHTDSHNRKWHPRPEAD